MQLADFEELGDWIGDGIVARCIINYLSKGELKAETLIIEEEYIDKDYLVDYSFFYSKCFEKFERFTKRIHIFSKKFSQSDVNGMLLNNEISQLEESYLGFIVLKPITLKSVGFQKNEIDIKERKIIGRTLLKTYGNTIESTEGPETRHYITKHNEVCFYGASLEVESLPFQTQDFGVSRCATVAIWIINQKLSELFGMKKYSLSGATTIATGHIDSGRSFPSDGLTLQQMLTFIKHLGLDYEVIEINSKNAHQIPYIIKAFVKVGIPIIAILQFKQLVNGKMEGVGYHAAVISGYRCDDKGILKEIYVHDDQLGPYIRVYPDDKDRNFLKWANEWLSTDADEVEVSELVIPLYPKIRIGFTKICEFWDRTDFNQFFNKMEIKERVGSPNMRSEFYLTTVQDYKNELLSSNIEDKLDKLRKKMPRFIWIIRFYTDSKPLIDIICDATSTTPMPIDYVKFQ